MVISHLSFDKFVNVDSEIAYADKRPKRLSLALGYIYQNFDTTLKTKYCHLQNQVFFSVVQFQFYFFFFMRIKVFTITQQSFAVVLE